MNDLNDNVQCKTFQTILDEARESYKPKIVHVTRSDCYIEIETNAKNISLWTEQLVKGSSN